MSVGEALEIYSDRDTVEKPIGIADEDVKNYVKEINEKMK